MKRNIITFLLLISAFYVNAQEFFGKATFTVPEGWQVTKTSETVTLEITPKKGVTCKIIISATQKGSVTTLNEYIQFRSTYGGSGIQYDNQRGAIIKYEDNGLASFFSKGTFTRGMIPVKSYFYSLSNGSQTLYYQLLTSNNECVEEFNQFMSELKMELIDNGAPAAKRKSSGGAPAAPAPMM